MSTNRGASRIATHPLLPHEFEFPITLIIELHVLIIFSDERKTKGLQWQMSHS